MNSPGGLANLRRTAGRIRRSFWRRALVLLYHRVTEVRPDPWWCAVTPENFREHLDVIRGYGTAMSLQELVKALRGGRFPRRAIVVTFDDGYADNLYNAKPLLEQFGIPATAFITTGYVGGQREFWWDALDKVLLQPNTLPGELRLDINGSSHHWELADSAVYTQKEAARDRHWRAREEAPSARQRIYRSVWELLHPVSDGERRKIVDRLQEWAGVEPAVRPTHRFLSLDEVRSLAEGELIEVGAHSITHSALSSLSPDEQRREVLQSKAALEELLNRRVGSFAYPYGTPSDFNLESIAAVREACFDCACTTVQAYVGKKADPFQLPRVYAPDYNGEQFERFLFDWFNGQY